MTENNSILDKIIESQEKQQAAQFNPTDLISKLFKEISTKESDILARRFGLLGKEKETLEQIGNYYNITRERIRQIETATIKKIKELRDFQNQVELAEHHITHLLENYGGFMEENHLLEEIKENLSSDDHDESSKFILSKLLENKIAPVKSDDMILNGWKLPTMSVNTVKEAVAELVEIIDKRKQLLNSDELFNDFKNSEFYSNKKDEILAQKLGADDNKIEEDIDKIINSYLKISKHIDQNILGEWGLNKWTSVRPKRMSDKVYLVLKKAGKPLHFTEITDLINQVKFDKKTAYPATIHNELILDDRYVLVGRGIYALKEWGYESGTVMDTIVSILEKADEPMTKEEIVKAVLDQRIVRKSTIYLALTNKDKIKKDANGKYSLVS